MATTVPTPVSPKVKAGILWGAVFAVLGAAVAGGAAAIDPHLFDSLGAFGPLIYSAITLGAAQLAAYLKKDPLRQAGAEAIASPEGTVSSAPALVVEPEEEAAPATTPAPTGTFGDPAPVPATEERSISDKPESVIQQ